MPYKASLHQYCLPEFSAEPPASWEMRLREVSPIRADLDHLRFRKFDPHEWWLNPNRPIWSLYSCKRIGLVDKERAAQFDKHWSELDAHLQMGRKSVVSDYQHFMWHTHGLYVKPFLLMQGAWGGTPARYTDEEVAFLDASGLVSEPFPLGFFEPCPFDERVVEMITKRDRLLKCANDLGALSHMDTPDGIQATIDAATRIKRETYLDTWKVMIQPAADFMGHWLKRSEHREELPPAPVGTASAVDAWKDHFMQTGEVIGATNATHRKLNVLLN